MDVNYFEDKGQQEHLSKSESWDEWHEVVDHKSPHLSGY